MARAKKRIYGRHPDGYEVLLAVPGDEVSDEIIKADTRPDKPAPKKAKD